MLLSRRFNTSYEDGNYHAVGGHLERNETLTQAIVREAKEEIGIDLLESNLKCVHVVHRSVAGGRFDFFFTADKWQGEPTILEPDKCDDLSWYELTNLPTNMVPYARHAIEQIQNNHPYSEFGW